MSKYFKPEEFKRCTPACDISQMDADFLKVLDKVREEAGIPLVLNRAYRSVAYEKQKGRPGTSSHTKGLAVDIRCNASDTRYKIVQAALALRVPRIGIGKTYVHLDTDPDKPQYLIWHYY